MIAGPLASFLRAGQDEPTVRIGARELPITIRRHARATRLTMRLAPDGSEVRITMPRWGRTIDALVFARARSEWIEGQLALVPEPAPIAAGGTLPYRGSELTIEWSASKARNPALDGAILHCGGPETALVERIRRWLEKEAIVLLHGDLAEYCARAGRDMPELRLSRAQRRWGSCSGERKPGGGGGAGGDTARRCIRINWRLVMAPDRVRRSVVAHEVTHLAHFDHSPAFHAALGRLFESDIAEADAWLKREGRALYAPFG